MKAGAGSVLASLHYITCTVRDDRECCKELRSRMAAQQTQNRCMGTSDRSYHYAWVLQMHAVQCRLDHLPFFPTTVCFIQNFQESLILSCLCELCLSPLFNLVQGSR